MKASTRILFLLFFLSAVLAPAQTIPSGTFKHIIIIVQENRTPDNIFGSGPAGTNCQNENPFEPGVDIEDGGYGYVPISNTLRQLELICNTSQTLNNGPTFDPDHTYGGWGLDFDSGHMDGFCHEYDSPTSVPPCPSYSYVQRSDVAPYFQIATAYGFANYMFQSNEGPSYPAHQFLFTGTSAPVAPGDPNSYYLDFVGLNAGFLDSGCPQGKQTNGKPHWVEPTGTEIPMNYYECYTHDSLVTNSNGDKGVSWRYYTPTTGIIWNAPAAIPEVCYGQNKNVGGNCTAAEFTNHIVTPNPALKDDGAPILTDIANCDLQQISWVIPDQVWSDHPSFDKTVSPPYGPSWVGNIINAIGSSWTDSNGKCDYWGNNSNDTTAIFVDWDDWGGFFDHVAPPVALEQNPLQGFTNCDPGSQWGCGYVYGFRVPLLVVSEYTQAAYVSGACGSSGCTNNTFPFQHDFGSILAFTEYNFGMSFIDLPDKGYADYNAPDWGATRGHIPLADFFSLGNQRSFTTITNLPYAPNFFETYYQKTGNPPTGPDGTSGEED